MREKYCFILSKPKKVLKIVARMKFFFLEFLDFAFYFGVEIKSVHADV